VQIARLQRTQQPSFFFVHNVKYENKRKQSNANERTRIPSSGDPRARTRAFRLIEICVSNPPRRRRSLKLKMHFLHFFSFFGFNVHVIKKRPLRPQVHSHDTRTAHYASRASFPRADCSRGSRRSRRGGERTARAGFAGDGWRGSGKARRKRGERLIYLIYIVVAHSTERDDDRLAPAPPPTSGGGGGEVHVDLLRPGRAITPRGLRLVRALHADVTQNILAAVIDMVLMAAK
jgi:hypothetical protein